MRIWYVHACLILARAVHAETLNIFPSQPMHVVVDPAPKVRTRVYALFISLNTRCIYMVFNWMHAF